MKVYCPFCSGPMRLKRAHNLYRCRNLLCQADIKIAIVNKPLNLKRPRKVAHS